MISSIHVTGDFQRLRKPKFFIIFLLLVFALAGVRAYAAPSIDADTTSFSSFYYYTGQNTYSMTDASSSFEIKIPLYCMYYNNSVSDGSFLNGYIRTSLPGYSFSFNGSTIAPSYFEVNAAPGLSCSSPTANSNSMTVYFDNHLKQNNFYFILGYYVFNFSEYTSLSITITPGAGLVERIPSVSYLYSSTSEFGLTQAIVTAINSASDIDTILNGLQDISENTELLTDVISGLSDNAALLTQIYQRIGQMQSADQTFYNNIDNLIDTISWKNTNVSFNSAGSNFDNLSNSVGLYNPLCMYLETGNYNGLLHFRLNIRAYATRYRNYFKCTFIGKNIDYNLIDNVEVYIFTNTGSYVDIYINQFNYGSIYLSLESLYPGSISVQNFNVSVSEYIEYSDIEYWTILNSLRTYKLMNFIDSYLNANVSSQVEQAATQAAGLAQIQEAAEQSLAALSPGKMEDLDSALQGMDILDTVQQSTTFWGYLIQQFSSRSGPLWGIFIFGLILGLIGFILRLRE